eukprot:g8037.t1 g8037   contig27:49391-51311(+)
MQSNQSGNAILESDEDAVAEGGNGENIVQESDEIVLFGSAFKVATNADAVASDGILNTPSKTSAGSAKNGGSPTSVAQFDVVNNEVANTNDGVAPPPPARSTKKSDESDLGNNEKDDTYRSAMNKMRRLMVNPSSGTNAIAAQDESGEQQVKFDPNNTSTDTSIFGDSANTIKNNNDGNNPDDSTIEDSSKRASGPIDVDTCTRHLTPTELRNLRAMHKLGYAHLRRNEISSALSVFTEILRGQGERHGKKSLEVAMAMHNLGVVCVKGDRYEEACRLCDGAARIRVEKLGKDHLDVAVSLAQQGVALMEIQEYPLALASFREALRIRRLAFGEKHPLVVRLLNNIGCALFEMEELRDSKIAFEEALSVQRYLMRENNAGGGDEEDEFEANFQSKKTEGVDAKGAHNMLLSIALTLRNLGSIHFRWGEYDESLVFYEEALLIQESVLGEDHKLAVNTADSINFVLQSKEENRQALLQDDESNIRGGNRIAEYLPSYEESKEMYRKSRWLSLMQFHLQVRWKAMDPMIEREKAVSWSSLFVPSECYVLRTMMSRERKVETVHACVRGWRSPCSLNICPLFHK